MIVYAYYLLRLDNIYSQLYMLYKKLGLTIILHILST